MTAKPRFPLACDAIRSKTARVSSSVAATRRAAATRVAIPDQSRVCADAGGASPSPQVVSPERSRRDGAHGRAVARRLPLEPATRTRGRQGTHNPDPSRPTATRRACRRRMDRAAVFWRPTCSRRSPPLSSPPRSFTPALAFRESRCRSRRRAPPPSGRRRSTSTPRPRRSSRRCRASGRRWHAHRRVSQEERALQEGGGPDERQGDRREELPQAEGARHGRSGARGRVGDRSGDASGSETPMDRERQVKARAGGPSWSC